VINAPSIWNKNLKQMAEIHEGNLLNVRIISRFLEIIFTAKDTGKERVEKEENMDM
jgi:hypothetical protein